MNFMLVDLNATGFHSKVLFGTRVFVGISVDNPHQTPNPRLPLKLLSARLENIDSYQRM